MDTIRDPYGNPYAISSQRPFRGCMLPLILILLAVLITLISCRSSQPVVVTRQQHHVAHQHDTILRIDTIETHTQTLIREADPVQLQELGLQLRQNERALLILQKQVERQASRQTEHKTDTVIQRDTIPVIVEVPARPERTTLRQLLARNAARVFTALMLFMLAVILLRIRHYIKQ